MTRNRITAYRGEIRAILALAWPMVIAQLAQVGTGVVDTLMAARYGAVDLAAIAIGYNIWLPLYLFFIGMLLGATVITAQDFGARRVERIRARLPQALWLALGLGLLAGPVCYQTGPLLDLLGVDPTARDKSLAYLQAVAFGMPAAAVFQALRCHTQGLGILRPFAVASILGFLANIPLNYAFIYGNWGAPELGAAGCGLATAISMWLGPLFLAAYMRRSRPMRDYLPPLHPVLPDPRMIGEIVRVGLPMGLTFFLEVAVYSVVALGIATLGNTAIASHQIAFNVWDVVYMPLISFGSAMATRVGHAIGARDRPGVQLAVTCGIGMTVLVGLTSMAILLAAPGAIVGLYTPDPAIHAMATTLVQLAALFIALDSGQVAASFGLRAFKDTRFPFVVLCLAYWLVAIPLGYWGGLVRAADPLAGTVSIWQSLIAGITLSSLLVFWRLARRLRAPLPAEGDAR